LDDIPYLDIVHFFVICDYIADHPVPNVEMVEVKKRPCAANVPTDMPAPADVPTSVAELAATLNALNSR